MSIISRQAGRPALLSAVALAACLPFAGCKEEKKAADASPAAPSVAERVVQAAEQNIRAGRSYPVAFRGVTAWTQAAPQKWAVCGLMTPFQDSPDIFVPFVSVATISTSPDKQVTQYQFEHRIGASTSEASRVYAALVTYCYDKGGPAQGSMRGAPSPPPLPDSVADPQAKAAPGKAETAKADGGKADGGKADGGKAAGAGTATGADAPKPQTPSDTTPASGDVTMRQAANLRTDPHGPTIRVLPQGTPLHVFGTAPGGWYQVGDSAPQGWVHGSMLNREP